MLAVIKTGGKQYKVREGDKIRIEKLNSEVGKEVVFDEVFLVADEVTGDDDTVKSVKEIKIGKPKVRGAKVTGKVLAQGRNDKVIVFKYKPKKRYKKKQGHRQPYTEVEITKISA